MASSSSQPATAAAAAATIPPLAIATVKTRYPSLFRQYAILSDREQQCQDDLGDLGPGNAGTPATTTDAATGLSTAIAFQDFTEPLHQNKSPMTTESDGNKYCIFLWKMLNSCESGSIGGDACRQFDVLNSALDDALSMASAAGKFEHLLGWTGAAANHGLHALLYRGDPDRNRGLFKRAADGWKKVFEKTEGAAGEAVGVSESLRSFAVWMCGSFQSLLKDARKEYGDYAKYTFNYIKKPRGVQKGPSVASASAAARSDALASAASAVDPASTTVVVTKASKDLKLGLVLAQEKGFTAVKAIDPKSPFAGTDLKVGMTLERINGIKFASFAEGLTLLKDAEGQVTIVANPVPTTAAATGASSSSTTTASSASAVSVAVAAAARAGNQKENSVPAKNFTFEVDEDDEPKPWEEEDFVPMRGGKQKTPNMIRNELQKYIDQCKADGSMTQTRIIEKMGVNNNTFRRFMNPKTYKDQWSATQNGTYWAAARLLAEAKYEQDKAKKSGAKRKAASGATGSGKKAKATGLSNSTAMSKADALAFIDRINSVEGVPDDQVYDTCPQLVAKIKAFLQRPGMSNKANLQRAMGNINSNSMNRFLQGKKQDQCGNVSYKAGYVFFEKLRILEGGKKTSARVKNECEHPNGFSLTKSRGGFYKWLPGL